MNGKRKKMLLKDAVAAQLVQFFFIGGAVSRRAEIELHYIARMDDKIRVHNLLSGQIIDISPETEVEV